MKLRNKKTGEIIDCKEILILREDSDGIWQAGQGNSLAELNEEWEDYKPKEPLIKDEKIRKVVRAWAELSGVDKCHFEHDDGSFAGKWYGISLPTSKYGEDIESGFYAIAELCGEWEDFGGKDARRQNPLAGLSPYDYSKRNIVTDHTEPCGGSKE